MSVILHASPVRTHDTAEERPTEGEGTSGIKNDERQIVLDGILVVCYNYCNDGGDNEP